MSIIAEHSPKRLRNVQVPTQNRFDQSPTHVLLPTAKRPPTRRASDNLPSGTSLSHSSSLRTAGQRLRFDRGHNHWIGRMKLRDCKKLNRERGVQAVIISDGCRDYVIEVRHAGGAGTLRDWRGRTKRFRALAEAHRVLRRAGVSDVTLAVRVAADEACAGPMMTSDGFSQLSLSH